MRKLLLVIALACAAQAEPPHASLAAVPPPLREALSTAIPRRVWLTWYGEKNGVTTMVGRAVSFDDVSDFMRALNAMAQCPKGLARVVERQRNGALRLELVASPGLGVNYSASDVHLLFTSLELKSTAKKSDSVEFELTFRAP